MVILLVNSSVIDSNNNEGGDKLLLLRSRAGGEIGKKKFPAQYIGYSLVPRPLPVGDKAEYIMYDG